MSGAARADGRPARLAVLASGEGSNVQAVLDACASGRLAARVVAVVSDRPASRALQRARAAGIPAHAVPPRPEEDRATYDDRLGQLVSAVRPDVVVLAGWMRILTMPFLGRFPGRVVNLHPALPGAFPGTRAIERAHQAGQRGEIDRTGVMVHLVPDEGVDDGPVLAKREVPIRAGETLEQLVARVHRVEHELLVDTLITLCQRIGAGRPR